MNARNAGSHASAGFTLIELMVTLVVLAIVLTAGLPALSEFVMARRLAAAADIVHAQTVFARNEALKRNETVTLRLAGGRLSVVRNDEKATLIREATLPDGVRSGSDFQVSFAGNGRLPAVGASSQVQFLPSAGSCPGGEEVACPVVRVDWPDFIRMCRNGADCT